MRHQLSSSPDLADPAVRLRRIALCLQYEGSSFCGEQFLITAAGLFLCEL